MLHHMELSVSKDHFYTSALATASFLKSQCPGGSVYVIGEPELMKTLYEAGFPMNDADPDYVFSAALVFFYEKIERAVKLIQKGAKQACRSSGGECELCGFAARARQALSPP